MNFTLAVSLVFIAGLVTAFATGLGALPFFMWDDISTRTNVGLWGFAAGIMTAASVFGLLEKAVAVGDNVLIAVGGVAGIALVVIADHIVEGYEFSPTAYPDADFKQLVLVLGVLTVHSFPEGIAIGVSFVELMHTDGMAIAGVTVPVLAVFMTIAISVHNIPEGLAIAIPLRAVGVERWRLVGWAVFSSLPQPIGAVIAYVFVRVAREWLPVGYGFAAGAMLYLVATEFVPEGLENGTELAWRGYPVFGAGFGAGVVVMVPFLVV